MLSRVVILSTIAFLSLLYQVNDDSAVGSKVSRILTKYFILKSSCF